MKTKLTLDQICDLLDDQVVLYQGDDRQILIKACNLIYDYIHKDDPDEHFGN